jgi:hypothetical protein
MTSQPRKKAVRATALTAAFIPGASPPLVKIPILITNLLSLASRPIMQEPATKHILQFTLISRKGVIKYERDRLRFFAVTVFPIRGMREYEDFTQEAFDG